MAAHEPNPDPPKVEATPEIKQLLRGLTDGHSLDIVDGGVVVARLVRVESAARDPSALAKSLEMASRVMDRYRDAYKELAK
jgi:antitoxin (DNA-binding transcriptional repressor) of toxin-antitoxin stability system